MIQIAFSTSSHQRCSVKTGVLKNFTEFTEKHLDWSLFFNKVADLTPATLLKKRLQHRRFPMNSVKFLRAYFLENISRRLLLVKFASIRSFSSPLELRFEGQNFSRRTKIFNYVIAYKNNFYNKTVYFLFSQRPSLDSCNI